MNLVYFHRRLLNCGSLADSEFVGAEVGANLLRDMNLLRRA